MGSLRMPEGLDSDIEQVTSALEKIGDPWLRYAISMSVEMIAERIAELERTATVRIRYQTRSGTQPEAVTQAIA